MKRSRRVILALILALALALAFDAYLAISECQNNRCVDISDPRFNPPLERCGPR